MDVQSSSQNHVDVLVKRKDMIKIRFTGFYSHPELNQRQLSWDLIRNISQRVSEDWIIGGDFYEIMDDFEKSGGRQKSRVAMEDFRKVMDDMAVVDIKSDRGWFTWSNSRRGTGLVHERLDRFFVSSSWLKNVSVLATDLIRQANSDHDVVVLDTMGRRPKGGTRDPRLLFRFEECWAKDVDAKRVIKDAWEMH